VTPASRSSSGVDLGRRPLPQQRLHRSQVGEDAGSLRFGLTEVVAGAGRESFQQYLLGDAQEHDGAESPVELPLVGHAPGHEQRSAGVLVQQCRHAVLPPHRLGGAVRPRDGLDPAARVRVDHGVAAARQLP